MVGVGGGGRSTRWRQWIFDRRTRRIDGTLLPDRLHGWRTQWRWWIDGQRILWRWRTRRIDGALLLDRIHGNRHKEEAAVGEAIGSRQRASMADGCGLRGECGGRGSSWIRMDAGEEERREKEKKGERQNGRKKKKEMEIKKEGRAL